MAIIVRDVIYEDKERALWIEKYALPNVIYLNDVWDWFISKSDGYFLGALLDNELAGFGKITRLFDDVGWLETLRVHPDYQGKRIGEAIYEEYLKRAKELGLNKIGLFTEWDNYRSFNLATKYGFKKYGNYADYSLDVNEVDNYNGSFKLIDIENAEDIIAPYYNKINRFVILNKTFFPLISGLGKNLAKRQWSYMDDENNFVIIGYRMSPHKATYLAYYDGDFNKILSFANHIALKNGSKRISAIREKVDLNVKELEANGFKNVEDFMCLYKDLD